MSQSEINFIDDELKVLMKNYFEYEIALVTRQIETKKRQVELLSKKLSLQEALNNKQPPPPNAQEKE